LANRGLHLVWIGLRLDSVEVQIHGWLINAVEVLEVGERDQATIAEPVRLIWRQLCCGVAGSQAHPGAGRDGEPGETAGQRLRRLSKVELRIVAVLVVHFGFPSSGYFAPSLFRLRQDFSGCGCRAVGAPMATGASAGVDTWFGFVRHLQ